MQIPLKLLVMWLSCSSVPEKNTRIKLVPSSIRTLKQKKIKKS